MLDEHDRRELAEIERQLRRDDPALAHTMSPVAAEPPPWVPEAWTATGGFLLFMAGMLGLGQFAAFCGLALITLAALRWTGERGPATRPLRPKDVDDRT